MDSELVIAGGDAAELLKSVKETFDEVSRLITMSIVVAWRCPIGARWDDRFCMVGFNMLHQSIAVIAFIRDHSFSTAGLFKQGERLTDVGLFGTGQGEPDGIAERINDTEDFAAEAAARTTQSLWAMFFFAPAACGWARTAVLSSITSSKSRSALRACKTRFHTPLFAHREKRMNVVCQLPSSAGKSRHDAPIRPIHNTASTNNRVSFAVTPRSLALPGSKSRIRSHCSSLSTRRSIAQIPSMSWDNSLTLIVNTT